uniref:Uncharacterized protein n=1 Tax=Solanum lycopersicum TaxID=4081 RepID=A0A3Q7I462_SOLLC
MYPLSKGYYQNNYRENITAMARKYRVAMAIALSQLCAQLTPKSFPGSPNHTGGKILQVNSHAISDDVRKQLYHHTDSIMCCTIKMNLLQPAAIVPAAPVDVPTGKQPTQPIFRTVQALSQVAYIKRRSYACQKNTSNAFTFLLAMENHFCCCTHYKTYGMRTFAGCVEHITATISR